MVGLSSGASTALLALSVCLANAQTGTTLYTLEALICRADKVFTGTIERTEAADKKYFTVTVRVDEVIKGEVGKVATLTVRRFDQNEGVFVDAAAQRSKLMWFQGPGKQNILVDWWCLQLTPGVQSDPGGIKWQRAPILTMDMKVIDNLPDAVKAARAFVRKSPDIYPWHSIDVPWPVLKKAFPDGLLYVWGTMLPVSPQLESIAVRMIKDPVSFVPRGAEFDERAQQRLRAEGIRALAHFKSDSNIALLKRYLNDPYNETIGSKGRADWTEYPVREAAQDVLKRWEVKIDEPTH